MNESNGKATDSDKWPTARVVASRLGISRQQVYKLADKGKLSAKDTRVNGVKVRLFDPSSVSELAGDATLEQLLDGELAEDDDDDGSGGGGARSAVWLRLASTMLTESREAARDARKGQQEAYELVQKPAQEYIKLLMARVAELEKQLNAVHDEQRDARREDREAALFQSQLDREQARKDQFWQMFVAQAPTVLEQLKQSMNGGPPGPLMEFLKKSSPEEQRTLVMALKTVVDFKEPSPEESEPVNEQFETKT